MGTIGYVVRGSVAAYYAKYYLGGDTQTLSLFLATGVVAAILAMVGWLLTFFEYVPGQAQSDFSLMGIALMLTIIPGFFHFLMGLLMRRYIITDDYYQRLKQGEINPTAKSGPETGELNPSIP